MKHILIASILFAVAFANNASASDRDQVKCLADNMYYEARNQEAVGIIAVGYVVLNRVKSKFYPNNICSVVKQAVKRNGKIQRNLCQFSWYCDGRSDKITDQSSYRQMIIFALMVIHGDIGDPTMGSIYYHTTSVSPYWAPEKTKIVQIGAHIFYR